ncbi:hypothetical protein [Endozoicomonas sp. ALC066]|uniref:hypothetical protein n=1 Tax=Endozoicomonas sp. ALC066 TaxID=3403078 RepID=UPI003BB55AF8
MKKDFDKAANEAWEWLKARVERSNELAKLVHSVTVEDDNLHIRLAGTGTVHPNGGQQSLDVMVSLGELYPITVYDVESDSIEITGSPEIWPGEIELHGCLGVIDEGRFINHIGLADAEHERWFARVVACQDTEISIMLDKLETLYRTLEQLFADSETSMGNRLTDCVSSIEGYVLVQGRAVPFPDHHHDNLTGQ